MIKANFLFNLKKVLEYISMINFSTIKILFLNYQVRVLISHNLESITAGKKNTFSRVFNYLQGNFDEGSDEEPQIVKHN